MWTLRITNGGPERAKKRSLEREGEIVQTQDINTWTLDILELVSITFVQLFTVSRHGFSTEQLHGVVIA